MERNSIETELNKINNVEEYILDLDDEIDFYDPILEKLKKSAQLSNEKGQLLFLGSWGMSPEEVGIEIKKINSESVFRVNFELRMSSRCTLRVNLEHFRSWSRNAGMRTNFT